MTPLNEEEKQALKEGSLVSEVLRTSGWREVIQPLLESYANKVVVDPRKFKSDEEYLYAQKTAWAYGQFASDLLMLLEQKKLEAEQLDKKQKGEVKDKLKEGLS